MSGSSVLAGSGDGRALLARLLAEVTEPANPEPMYLDFMGVEVATASFLRDGPLAYRQMVRARGSRIYPVIANAVEKILDDLQLLLTSRNDAILCCDLPATGRPSNVRLVGNLDEKQLLTFQLVEKLREVNVAGLQNEAPSDPAKPTAWNNRLSALVDKGLIMEFARGRSKVFRFPLEA